MPYTNDGLHIQEYVYDFDIDGGAQGEIVLSDKDAKDPVPNGAVIKSVTAKVVTAFTSGGAGTLAWGNGDDADGYSGAALALGSLTDNALFNGYDNDAALLWDTTDDHPLYVNVADSDDGKFSVTIGAADMTAGKMVFLVEYLYPSES